MQDLLDGYQLPSWPKTPISRELWNTVLGNIDARLKAREMLEASFELLQQQGVQAALDYIQVSIAPQLSALAETIADSQERIDKLLEGNAPNAQRLGGQLPEFYATAQALAEGLSHKADAVAVGEALAHLTELLDGKSDEGHRHAIGGIDGLTQALADLSTAIQQAGSVPVGTIIDVYGNGTDTIPGYLKFVPGLEVTAAYSELRAFGLRNGWAINAAGNPVMPSGAAANALIKRAWRAGQGRDAGRTFGSVQEDAMQGHRHSRNPNNLNEGTLAGPGSNGGFATTWSYLPGVQSSTGNPVTDGANGEPRTSSETRMANLTITWYIKAYGAHVDPGTMDVAKIGDDIADVASRVNTLEAGRRKRGAKVTPAGTAILYTGIPTGVSSFTIHFRNVTFSAAAQPFIKVGPATGVLSSGYSGTLALIAGSSGYSASAISTAINLMISSSNTITMDGKVTFVRVPGTNDWGFTGQFVGMPGNYLHAVNVSGGIELVAELDRFQVGTLAGTATMSGKAIWVEWEIAA